MQYLVQPPAASVAGSPHEITAKSYLGSELQQPPYVLARACLGQEQLARIIVRRNFWQGFASWVTLGLVAPATITYECANAAGQGELGNSSDGGAGR
jgi:hypothetical protein